MSALISRSPLTIPYYFDQQLADWVDYQVTRNSIQRSVVFSSSMGQYVNSRATSGLRTVVDLVDVDSDKWRQYSQKKIWPISWLYRREADLLLDVEKSLISRSQQSLLVSSSEANLMRRLTPDLSQKIDYYNNGVDAVYFDPNIDFVNPFSADSQVLAFTGAMDYWPNVDAVCWFVDQVFPELRRRYPRLEFYIVGRNPIRDVINLGKIDGVTVTGAVDDVRPYLKYATAIVAPLRIARGIQNKILEAMAMENRVLASTNGLEGIDAELGAEVLLANSLDDYLEYLPKVLTGECDSMGERARDCVLRQFDWDSSLPIVSRFLEEGQASKTEGHGVS